MNRYKFIFLPTVIILFLLGVRCNKIVEFSQKSQLTDKYNTEKQAENKIAISSPKIIDTNTTTTKIIIYEVKDFFYTCDKTEARVVEVPKTKAVVQAALEILKMPDKKSMDSYLNKPIFIKDGIAYLDWKKSFVNISNVNTSCGSDVFFSEINKTLTQFSTINKVIHSIEGDYKAFYNFMQIGVCPDEVKKYCTSTSSN